MDTRTLGLPGSFSDATDTNSISSKGKEKSYSCLWMAAVSLVKLAWVQRLIVGIGGRNRNVEGQ